MQATITPPSNGDLRIILQQRSIKDGTLTRSWKGGPPAGTNMGKVLVIRAQQGEESISVTINYDKVIWSGLSWAVGEIAHSALTPGVPLTIECLSTETDPVTLETRLFRVEY